MAGSMRMGLWRITVAASAMMAANQAYAQEASVNHAAKETTDPKNAPDSEDRDGARRDQNDIIVTGSHIRGNTNTSPSFNTISRENFEVAGFRDVAQAINSIPQNFGGGLSKESYLIGTAPDQANLNTTFATSPNLRGLGSGATLTLLNGDRLPPAGYGLAVDISLIPTSAIDRVEVLADGASAIYGADAVAGVVNIITRRRFDGVETRGLIGGAEGGMTTLNGSVLAGGTVGRFSGVISGEYSHQTALNADEREASKNLKSPFIIVPRQNRGSVMGSGTFEINSDLALVADGLYSDSRLTTTETNTFYTSDIRVQSQQYVAGLGLNARIGETWSAALSGRLSRIEQKQTQNLVLPDGTAMPSSTDQASSIRSVQLITDGALFTLPSGPIKTSTGISYRNERFSPSPKSKMQSRDVLSIFGEIAVPIISEDQNIPLIHALTISTSGRYDHYSKGFGSAFVPKFSSAWDLNDEVQLSGSYSRSYRVPTFYESSSSYVAYILNVQDNTPSGTTKVLWIQGTGRELHPERSENYSFQVKYNPTWAKNLNLSAGYYRFSYTGRISDPDPMAVGSYDIRNTLPIMLNRSATSGDISALIAQAGFFGGGNPAGVTTVVDSRLVNLSRTDISGFEGRVSYSTSIGASALSFESNLNYIDKFVDYVSPGAAPASRAGEVLSPSRWRARTQAQWSAGRVSAFAAWNYVGAYHDNRMIGGAPGEVPVSAWNTFDASFTLHLGSDRDKDTRLTLVATNLFNARPPYIAAGSPLRPTNWDPTNASVVGRFLSVELIKKW